MKCPCGSENTVLVTIMGQDDYYCRDCCKDSKEYTYQGLVEAKKKRDYSTNPARPYEDLTKSSSNTQIKSFESREKDFPLKEYSLEHNRKMFHKAHEEKEAEAIYEEYKKTYPQLYSVNVFYKTFEEWKQNNKTAKSAAMQTIQEQINKIHSDIVKNQEVLAKPNIFVGDNRYYLPPPETFPSILDYGIDDWMQGTEPLYLTDGSSEFWASEHKVGDYRIQTFTKSELVDMGGVTMNIHLKFENGMKLEIPYMYLVDKKVLKINL